MAKAATIRAKTGAAKHDVLVQRAARRMKGQLAAWQTIVRAESKRTPNNWWPPRDCFYRRRHQLRREVTPGLLFAVVAILGTPGCLVGSGRVKSRGPWGHSTMTIKGSNGNNRHFIRAADGAWMPVKGLDAAKASRVVPINDSKATTEFLFRPNRLALEAAKDAQAKEVSASFFSESSKQSNKKSNPKAWPLEARIMTPVTLANRVYQASGAILETARPSTWPAYQVGYRYINLLSNVSPILARYAIDLPVGIAPSAWSQPWIREISVAAATTFPHPAQARVFAKKIQDDGTLRAASMRSHAATQSSSVPTANHSASRATPHLPAGPLSRQPRRHPGRLGLGTVRV